MRERVTLSGVLARHVGLVALTAVLSAVVGRPGSGGVVLGGAAIAAILLLYAAGFRLVVRGAGISLALGIAFAKLLAFLGVGWLLLRARRDMGPDPIGFALGVACFPAAAAWEALRARTGY